MRSDLPHAAEIVPVTRHFARIPDLMRAYRNESNPAIHRLNLAVARDR